MNKTEFEHIIDLYHQKEMSQSILETFILGYNNSFEPSADIAINKLISEKESLQKEYNEILSNNNLDSSFPFKDLDDEDSLQIQMNLHSRSVDTYYLEMELKSIVEMKIIYLFKFFEINLKKLLSIAFDTVNTRDLYRWESVLSFLKNKNIDLKSIEGYNMIFELKQVNNTLKHSDYISSDLQNKITEFKNVDEITYNELLYFYDRVKLTPKLFLNQLSKCIYHELYVFDETKIQKMADQIILRLNGEHANSLVSKLQKAYNIK